MIGSQPPAASPRGAPGYRRADSQSLPVEEHGGALCPIADIAVAAPGATASKQGTGLYSYRVPDDLQGRLGPGHLVGVPFGPRTVQGVVVAVEPRVPDRPLRMIGSLLDPLPVLTPAGVALAGWLARRYGESLEAALGTMLPPGVVRETAYVVALALPPAEALALPRLSGAQRRLIERLAEAPEGERVPLADLERELGREEVMPALTSLLHRRVVSRTADLGRPGTAARTERVLSLVPHAAAALAPASGAAGRRPLLSGRQADVVIWLLEQDGRATATDLTRAVPGASAAVAALRRKGLLLEELRPLRRDPLAHRVLAPTSPLPLTGQQQEAYEAIAAALSRRAVPPSAPEVFLLHGVTGSGKTEVYLQALAATFALGRQAFALVPEISLTPQTIARFAARFPGQIALLHSGLSQGERYDEWERLRRGDARAVVGARSAIFAPLAAPGLIILDEEHDASYKQSSGLRYHTRDVAVELARLTGAVVVLGSATPDVSTYFQATNPRACRPIHLLTMPARVASTGLPPVDVVDLRQELRSGNRGIFSRALLAAVRGSLERDEQAILYINRRGAASFVICRDCGFVVRCRACDLPFTYHSATREMICHRCDARTQPPETCTRCHSWRIRYFGLGTQKVEEEAAHAFPGARLLRWDRDVAAGKHGHEAILERFAAHEADILIGTQMVAKGLDIPLVTTVGVVSADTALNLPDFRAAERAFQVLTQVAGRAGRATGGASGPARPGRVVIQTYTPEHFAIQAAANHDYAAFYRDEIAFRAEAQYPPFARLLRLLYADRNETRCAGHARALADDLRAVVAAQDLAGTEILGPAPCFVSKIRHAYQWQVLVRGDIDTILPHVPRDWTRDVDPASLL